MTIVALNSSGNEMTNGKFKRNEMAILTEKN